MGQHKVAAYAKQREASEAHEVLLRYLAQIFPAQTRNNLLEVADHQIEWLKRRGWKLAPIEPPSVN